jgi:hypothetical protein
MFFVIVAEKDFGYNTTDVEGGQLVRTGNHKTKSGGSQTTAMYGRIKPDALEVGMGILFGRFFFSFTG